jgi:hypothetical protein
VEVVLNALMDFAEGKPITPAAVPELVKAVTKMFKPASILEWGEARAAAHFEVRYWSSPNLDHALKKASCTCASAVWAVHSCQQWLDRTCACACW